MCKGYYWVLFTLRVGGTVSEPYHASGVRQKNMFFGGDMRTEEHVFWKTGEHENMRRRAKD